MNILLWMQQRHLSCSGIYQHQQIKTVEEESHNISKVSLNAKKKNTTENVYLMMYL